MVLLRVFRAVLIFALAHGAACASSVTPGDPLPGGIFYHVAAQVTAKDQAEFIGHVDSTGWSFGASKIGRTSRVHWVALTVLERTLVTVRMEPEANVPWPSMTDPNRVAGTGELYPSFTLWRGWDNDPVPEYLTEPGSTPPDTLSSFETRANVDWAEDLDYVDHLENSVQPAAEKTFLLPPGRYTIALGSINEANPLVRQGFKATLKTDSTALLTGESYFLKNPRLPLTIPIDQGVLANDPALGAPVELLAEPQLGAVALQPEGGFKYTPGPAFSGKVVDFFSYHRKTDGSASAYDAVANVSTMAAAAGSYSGGLHGPATDGMVGLVDLTITKAGKWSGSIRLANRKYALHGSVSVDGALNFRSSGIADLRLKLQIGQEGRKEVKIELGELRGVALQSPFSSTSPTPLAGTYGLQLEATDPSPETPLAGPAKLKVSRTGRVVFLGSIQGAGSFSSSASLIALDGANNFALEVFARSTSKFRGLLKGTLSLANGPEFSPQGELRLTRPERILQPPKPALDLTYAVSAK